MNSVKVIIGGTVIDGTGAAPLRDATVTVAGERIQSVTSTAGTAVPEHAEVIDAHGQYVIPGLMDANAHVFGGWTPDLMLEYEGRYSDLVMEGVQVALSSGVTTVFDTWGPLEPLITVRDGINRGEVVGSRMFVAGHIIGFGGPLSPDGFAPGSFLGSDTVDRINSMWEHSVGADLLWCTPDEVRRRVRSYIERSGVDFVKYAACAHLTPLITFSASAQRAIVEEAHRAGITAQAHTLSVESLRMEIEAGADVLQHGNITGTTPIPDETFQTIIDRQLPVAALVGTERYLAWVGEHGSQWSRTIGFGQTSDENNRRLIKAGARMLLTVDGSVLGPRISDHPSWAHRKGAVDLSQHLGEGHFLWLEAVTERGMAPMEALLSATRYVAEAYGVAADVGTLTPGKRADLIVLDANPLADVRNYRRIAKVMKDGVLVDRDALPVHRIVTATEKGAI